MPNPTPAPIDDAVVLAEGRRQFFAAQGFDDDGGYEQPWAEAMFGPFPYAVPNLRSRADALRVHDLHHVLTGYDADWRSESWISAWELGSGGAGRYPYAWFIALFGLWVGLWASALGTWRAFVRGRGSANLYGQIRGSEQLAAWLARPVGEIRTTLGVRSRVRRATVGDALMFSLWVLAATVGAVVFVLGSPFLVLLALGRRMGQMACPHCPCSGARSG